MTTITIHDEATRRVAEQVVWACAHDNLGYDGTGMSEYHLVNIGEAALGLPFYDYAGLVEEIDVLITTLTETRALAARIRGFAIGDTIELPATADEVREALTTRAIPQIEEYGNPQHVDGGFFAQPPAVRQMLLDSRDAAHALLADLQVEAVA